MIRNDKCLFIVCMGVRTQSEMFQEVSNVQIYVEPKQNYSFRKIFDVRCFEGSGTATTCNPYVAISV